MEFLYRGVNLEMHLKGVGLKSKGENFSIELQHGSRIARHGSGAVHGNSPSNAIVGHQINSEEFRTSGISTTPHFEIARRYALHDNHKGIIYKIDRSKLNEFNIDEFIVKKYVPFPEKPKDEEVILRNRENKVINEKIVVDIIHVDQSIK